MLNINVVIGLLNFYGRFIFKNKGNWGQEKNDTHKKFKFRKKYSPLNNLEFQFSKSRKSKFLSGKLFSKYYYDMKIIENKVNLNYDLLHSDIFIGVFSYRNSSLMIGKFLKKLYFYDRYRFFKFEIYSKFLQKKIVSSKISQRYILSVENNNLFFKNFHIFNNFRSRINLGSLEKLFSMRIDNFGHSELFLSLNNQRLKRRFKYFSDTRIIQLRKTRVSNLEKFPYFFKKNKNPNFNRGLLNCFNFSRFFLDFTYFLTGNILFFKEGVLFEINKSLYDWIFQLKKENSFISVEDMLYLNYLYIKGTATLHEFLFFKRLNSEKRKKFKSFMFNQPKIGSLYGNELTWNNTLSSSELSLDFFLRLSDIPKFWSLHCKWKYFIQLILFHIHFIQRLGYFLRSSFNEKKFFLELCLNLKSTLLNEKGWSNIIFDSNRFFKSSQYYQSNRKQLSDIYQTNKIFSLLSLKSNW